MSLRKKSAFAYFQEKNGNKGDEGSKTPVSFRGSKLFSIMKTPSMIGIPDSEKKKQRSSLKKIKKLLGSHSKKKHVFESSPMIEQLKHTKQEKKGVPMKKSLSLKTVASADLTNGNGSVKTSKSLSFQTSKQHLEAADSGTQPSNHDEVTCHPTTSSKLPASARLSNTDLQNIPPEKRPRLSPTTDSESQLKDAMANGKKVRDLSWWNPSTNPFHSSVVSRDSTDEGAMLFESLIQPVTTSKFFKEIWEKKPLLVRRHNSEYNNGWFSSAELDRILREEKLMFGENIDVVTYVDGKRETHNPAGRAFPSVVWDFYQQGCSVRLLNPQTYSVNVWKMLSMLQEYFGCMAGANVYLTPAGTQGFAPHYDDIEAFILQLEGKKRWRVYEPRSESEVLPRFSSPNFTDADLSQPVLDTVLEPGDLLYFPRGYIHQGCTMDDAHSLHMTVSVGQKNTWGDLLEKLVPRALEIAMEEEVDLRRSLPRDYLNYMGVAFSDQDCPARQKFLRTVESLMTKMLSYAPVDGACDQMAKKFLEDSLPPVLSEAEKECCIVGSGEKWDERHQKVTGAAELDPDTQIKIIRKGCLRLISEEKVCIYHNLENARVYHAAPLQCIEVEPDEAEAVEYLLNSYPEYVPIESLPLENLTKQLELANTLYERGLLMTQDPLEPIEGDDDSSDCECEHE